MMNAVPLGGQLFRREAYMLNIYTILSKMWVPALCRALLIQVCCTSALQADDGVVESFGDNSTDSPSNVVSISMLRNGYGQIGIAISGSGHYVAVTVREGSDYYSVWLYESVGASNYVFVGSNDVASISWRWYSVNNKMKYDGYYPDHAYVRAVKWTMDDKLLLDLWGHDSDSRQTVERYRVIYDPTTMGVIGGNREE